MKMVAIVGVLDLQIGAQMWTRIASACESEGIRTSLCIEHAFYLPWQKQEIQRYAEHILRTYDTGEDLILIGHSFGGIIACAIAPRFKKSTVRVVVTINTPHKITPFYSYFGLVPQKSTSPIITFGSFFDLLVPFFLTKYPGGSHTLLFTDHLYCFIHSNAAAKKIAAKIKDSLLKH